MARLRIRLITIVYALVISTQLTIEFGTSIQSPQTQIPTYVKSRGKKDHAYYSAWKKISHQLNDGSLIRDAQDSQDIANPFIDGIKAVLTADSFLVIKLVIHILLTLNTLLSGFAPWKIRKTIREQSLFGVLGLTLIDIYQSLAFSENHFAWNDAALGQLRQEVTLALKSQGGSLAAYACLALLAGASEGCALPVLVAQAPTYVKTITLLALTTLACSASGVTAKSNNSSSTESIKKKQQQVLSWVERLLPRFISAVRDVGSVGLTNESVNIRTGDLGISSDPVVSSGMVEQVPVLLVDSYVGWEPLESASSLVGLFLQSLFFSRVSAAFAGRLANRSVPGALYVLGHCTLLALAVQYLYSRGRELLVDTELAYVVKTVKLGASEVKVYFSHLISIVAGLLSSEKVKGAKKKRTKKTSMKRAIRSD